MAIGIKNKHYVGQSERSCYNREKEVQKMILRSITAITLPGCSYNGLRSENSDGTPYKI